MFINLPVKDLQKATEFFKKLGFSIHPDFSDDKAVCVVFGEHMYAMLLTEEFFKTFTRKNITDAHNTTEAIIALSVDTKEEVDDIFDRVIQAGGAEVREPDDHGWMYGKSFEDLDGHQWEILWMHENGPGD